MILERGRTVAALPLVLAVLACGSDATPAAPEPSLQDDELGNLGHSRLQVYGTDMTEEWENVAVKHDGVPLNDATVMVNGEVIPQWAAVDGVYSGQLHTPVAAGQTIALEVTRERATVTGIGTVPDRPVLTSPSMGAIFAPEQDVVVTWTSPSEPDYFEVLAQWSCGPTCGTGVWLEADASSRTLTIPAGSLPSGKAITIEAFAYNDGTLEGDYVPWLPYPGMNIRAGSNQVTINQDVSQDHAKLVVYGTDIALGWANVVVLRDGMPVADATVVVNGNVLSQYDAAWGRYYGPIGDFYAGLPVSLQVASEGLTVTGSGTVPDSPLLTSPSTGATFASGEDIAVTWDWTSVTEPDYFTVWATWSCGPYCGTGARFEAAASARSLTIPASGLPLGQQIGLGVFAYDDGTLGGDYAPFTPYPGMNIRAESNEVTVSH